MPELNGQLDLKSFEANPSLFMENAIKEYLATSPMNRLENFGNAPIFDDVLVGFADGDDPIFQAFKKIIGDFHLTPREIMEIYQQSQGNNGKKQPAKVSVLALILPMTYETRLTMRPETQLASLRANHATFQGHHLFVDMVPDYAASLLEKLGYQAVVPASADFWKMIEAPDGPSSNWSEKHAAYAAGLGTFGHNRGLITPKGTYVFVGSVVTDAAVTPSPRVYENYLANCLFYREGACGRCIERCPSGALTKEGYDKRRCQDYHNLELSKILKQLGREGYIGREPSCGLCQTKVPCEGRIPPSVTGKKRE